MALELVGGALLSSMFQVTFDKLASSEIWDYFRGRKLNEKLLKKLKRMLRSIDAVIDDAEQKMRNPRVRAWLDDVKDAVLEAEELLDEIDIQVFKSNPEGESQTDDTSKVWNFSNTSFDKQMESSMQLILDDLEDLERQSATLGLKAGSGFGVGSGGQASQKLPSTCLLGETVICGRDDDKEIIFNWLMSDTEHKLSIISIVGMGGMGKTTLAQHLYNDPRVEGKFDVKAWVCVSDEFDVFKVTRAILEAITGSTDDSRDLNMLHVKLKERLSGRKFFLVLDDIWNEDREKWEALQTPLNYGVQRSKILVTTRSKKVASIMRSTEIRQLKQLQGEHCWQLFAKYAFQDEDPQKNPGLKEIGRKITKKCQGLPLALKTIGSLLRTKSPLQEWKRILESEIWDLPEEDNNIIPALMLSYLHLPSHLKRCFAYCSLFPKDYEFEKEHLILLWMAENFLKCSRKSMTMEEVGEHYFNDLLLRSFFQQSSRDEMCFVMHDLLNDLTKYVSGDFCFKSEVGEAQNISKRTRHVSCLRDSYEVCAMSEVVKATRLRTFLSDSRLSSSLMHDLVSRFKFLRVLSMSGYSRVTEVPDSLANLKHLRSLDLSNTEVKKLPDSTCLLCNLQILKLADCTYLEELPNFLGNLNHLRYLDLSRTRVKKLPDSTYLLCNLQILKLAYCTYLEELPLNLHKLTNLRYLDLSGTKVREMPMHMEKLKNLQALNPFNVGKGNESNMQQLGELNLHGTLLIWNLQNITNPLDALAANLKNKIHLVKLELEWEVNHYNSQQEREVLDKLQPSKHLRELSIYNYGGTGFPDWFGDNSFINVVSLQLSNCENCVQLPPLGLLSSLKKLEIAGLRGIVVIGSEFYGNESNSSSTIPFASLKTLSFINMEEWEEWECETLTGAAFPCLEELYISNCPKLKGLLPEQLPCLKNLTVCDCEKLMASIPEHTLADTSLERLYIIDCPNMNIFPTHRCYNFLEVSISKSVDSLRTFSLDFFPKLRRLSLEDCSNLEMISQEHDHNLTSLTLGRCPKFVSLPECMHNLQILYIRDCPRLELFSSDGGFPPNLKWLHLENCSKLVASQKCALGNTSLVTLSINGVDMESFPDHGSLPISLTILQIQNCPNLKYLDYRGLCHLSSLSELGLSDCPRLECLPEEGLPGSISNLNIRRCPLLKQRCQKRKGQDWEKISRIQYIWIDDHYISGGVEAEE